MKEVFALLVAINPGWGISSWWMDGCWIDSFFILSFFHSLIGCLIDWPCWWSDWLSGGLVDGVQAFPPFTELSKSAPIEMSRGQCSQATNGLQNGVRCCTQRLTVWPSHAQRQHLGWKSWEGSAPGHVANKSLQHFDGRLGRSIFDRRNHAPVWCTPVMNYIKLLVPWPLCIRVLSFHPQRDRSASVPREVGVGTHVLGNVFSKGDGILVFAEMSTNPALYGPVSRLVARTQLRITCQPCKPYFSSLCNSHMGCRTQDQLIGRQKLKKLNRLKFGLQVVTGPGHVEAKVLPS